jgi:hypothetical protein
MKKEETKTISYKGQKNCKKLDTFFSNKKEDKEKEKE